MRIPIAIVTIRTVAESLKLEKLLFYLKPVHIRMPRTLILSLLKDLKALFPLLQKNGLIMYRRARTEMVMPIKGTK
jgi:hypothetical protein